MQLWDVIRILEKSYLAEGGTSRDFQLKEICRVLESVDFPSDKFSEYGEILYSDKAESQLGDIPNEYAYLKADRVRGAWYLGKALWPELKDQLRRKREEVLNQFQQSLMHDYMRSEQLALELMVSDYCDVGSLRRDLVKAVKPDTESLADEQLDAIADISHSCLLRARAGSGKTTVIKHKVDFLIRHAGFDPNEILVTAFNKVAADKVKNELRSQFGHSDFSTARTFHSLAYQIVNPSQDILLDQKAGNGTSQSEFVEALFRSVIDTKMEEQLYYFLREEMQELEEAGSLLSKEDYYVLRRNRSQDSLKGDFVNSVGEKWIADFLFEHDVEYMFERPWPALPGKLESYHPSFSVKAGTNWHNMIIEYWEAEDYQSNPSKRDVLGLSVNDQVDMAAKRNYWLAWNQKNPRSQIIYLEMCKADTLCGRESFEKILKDKLEEASYRVHRLPTEKILEKLKKKVVPRLAKMCLQYINKAMKSCYSPEDLEEKLKTYKIRGPKEKMFLELANQIYAEYQQEKLKQNKIDFDDLMHMAEKSVHASEGCVVLSKKDQRPFSLRGLKWLMIDEYQDFSPLFFNLIRSIRQYNPGIRLFCVGDNWQAINGFAGSELRFFEEFESFFEGARLLELRNNYRSQPVVVDESNRFMRGEPGSASIPKAGIPASPLKVFYIGSVPFDESKHVLPPDHPDHRYQILMRVKGETRSADIGGDVARQLKLCRHLMLKHDLKQTSFMILSRTNSIGFACGSLWQFKKKLKSCFEAVELSAFRDFDEQVQCWTAHGSKGAEADVVIILGVFEKRFPMLHPDNELYMFLGDTVEKVYREERRLFYVAITRAKQALYFITERGRESLFLNSLTTERGSFPYRF